MESVAVNKRCCIVVPIISTELGLSELVSIQSISNLKENYPILFIGRRKSYTSNLSKLNELLPDRPFTFIEFDSRYFVSLISYSNLLMSSGFYRRFSRYDYLLIFQTDALILRGDLSTFIRLDKPYFGAPWIDKNRATQKLLIGNGGLSLRKVDYFIEITRLNSIFPSKWWFNFTQQRFLRWGIVGLLFPLFYVLDVIVKVFGRSLFFEKMRLLSTAEDVSFAKCLVQHQADMPTLEEAVDFSFESNPQRCFEINNQRLPFGCHAWERYDLAFWKAHVSEVNALTK